MDSDDDVHASVPSPELVATAPNENFNLLPNKSREKYEFAYKRFVDYCRQKNTTSRSENFMIEYFSDLSAKLKASTLWSNYSMLRATMSIKEDIDISKYTKLRALLKRQARSYKPKKSKVLSKEQIETFITQAPDHTYLMNKVSLIFGVAGACRLDELCQLNLNDIEDLGSKLLIKIPDNKTKKPKSFVIYESCMPFYRKYAACRPENFDSSRFFYKYLNGRGYRQVVGVHQFGKIPQIVAKFLKLPNVDEYTGHCFRLSSATILVNAGTDLIDLKRHGEWKSPDDAEGCEEESFTNDSDVPGKIFIEERVKEETANSNSNDADEKDITINFNNDVDISSKIQSIMFNNCTKCNITININK